MLDFWGYFHPRVGLRAMTQSATVEQSSPRSNPLIASALRFVKRIGLALAGGFVLVWFFGSNIPSSGVPELERSILELNGFLLAFVGVMFTGMVADVRQQTDLAAERRRTLSRALRWEALGSFSMLILSLTASISVTVLAYSPPWNVSMSVAVAEIFPIIPTILGLSLLAHALAQYANIDSASEIDGQLTNTLGVETHRASRHRSRYQ